GFHVWFDWFKLAGTKQFRFLWFILEMNNRDEPPRVRPYFTYQAFRSITFNFQYNPVGSKLLKHGIFFFLSFFVLPLCLRFNGISLWSPSNRINFNIRYLLWRNDDKVNPVFFIWIKRIIVLQVGQHYKTVLIPKSEFWTPI